MNKDISLYEKMNLKTDAIIINQCDKLDRYETCINGKNVKFYSYPERGVGRSRNHALMSASGEICLLADEDMIYVDGYENIVIEAFNKFRRADAIIFQVNSLNPERPLATMNHTGKISLKRAIRYGACRIAFKRESILRKNIWFSLMFGGGATYGSGEDTIFISDLYKNGLNVYSYNKKIADIIQENSSWFTGYNEKYFFDKGALYYAMYPRYAKIITLYSGFKMYKRLDRKFSYFDIVKWLYNGINDYKLRLES